MKCIITGGDTNFKWKNFPIKKEFVELAKLMQNEPGFLYCTQRERIIILQQRWNERIKEETMEKEESELSFIDRILLKMLGKK